MFNKDLQITCRFVQPNKETKPALLALRSRLAAGLEFIACPPGTAAE
jgi:hypothetical protein